MPKEGTVGEILDNALSVFDMKQTELAEMTGIPKSVICDIIKGNRSISAEMAVLIECAIQIPALYLMQVQTQNEIEEATKSQRIQEMMASIYDWKAIKQQLPVAVLKKLGIINNNAQQNVQSVFKMFEVNSSDELISLKTSDSKTYLRRSHKIHFDDDTLFIWKYFCFNEASKVYVKQKFNKSYIDDLANELIEIFYVNSDTFAKVKDAFFNAGIRLLYIEKVGQLPVDGMCFWRDDNPTVVLTRRMKNIDSFAFSTMHELGHLKYHIKKYDEPLINFDTTDRDNCEAEADKFAQNAFISKDEWDEFIKSIKDVNPFAVHTRIKALAESKKVNPQILFGRYMHDTKQYRLKRVFDTEIR